jgi:DNA-binding IclR family transcriptional regulator
MGEARVASAAYEKRIKSADRVLEIFEMFGPDRQALTVMEVSRALDVPQSSTSELLGNLVRRGYLTRDRGGRLFRPTVRVALLGAWVKPSLFRYGKLLPMMDHIHEQTQLTASLAKTIGVTLKHVHSTGAHLPSAIAKCGDAHMLHSPFGHVLLSQLRADEVRKIVHRLNAENDPELHARYQDVINSVDQVKRQGFAVGRVEAGWSGIAVLLPQGECEEQLTVGIIGRAQEIDARRDELVRTLRQGVSQFIGPRVSREARELQIAYM